MTSTPDAGRDFGDLHRVVVKVGSGIIAPAGRLDPLAIKRIAADVTALRDTGREVVLDFDGATHGDDDAGASARAASPA